MDIRVEVGPFVLSAGLWTKADLEAEEEDPDDDEGRPGRGAADRGLDLSTHLSDRDDPHFDLGTVIESEVPETGWRTGFS